MPLLQEQIQKFVYVCILTHKNTFQYKSPLLKVFITITTHRYIYDIYIYHIHTRKRISAHSQELCYEHVKNLSAGHGQGGIQMILTHACKFLKILTLLT